MEMLGPEVCRVGGPPTSRQDGVTACSELAALGQGQASSPGVKPKTPSLSAVWAPLSLLGMATSQEWRLHLPPAKPDG